MLGRSGGINFAITPFRKLIFVDYSVLLLNYVSMEGLSIYSFEELEFVEDWYVSRYGYCS